MPMLASERKLHDRIVQSWPAFLLKRGQRLTQAQRFGTAAEKITIALLEDLFSDVLDWSLADLNHEIAYADFVVTQNGIKTLIVEAKRPGKLATHRSAIDQAITQVRQYADQQRVPHVAVTDGIILYAGDLEGGVMHDRVFVRLDQSDPPVDLWWLSVHGIYRTRPQSRDASWSVLPAVSEVEPETLDASSSGLLHSKYKLPSRCFAYVGDANRPTTWRLPYRLADGSIDRARLPKAIQAILSNYRGAKVRSVPEAAIPEVLMALARAAHEVHHMPPDAVNPAPIYRQLAEALHTLGVPEEAWTKI